MRIEYQDRDGLLPEHQGISPISHPNVRLTIPARERLEESGATITLQEAGITGRNPVYHVQLGPTMPGGLVACAIPDHRGAAVRTDEEPEWPIEIPDFWMQARWAPCPVCGAPLVWYEAGYVPGYRVCARPPHHHCLVL